MNSCAEEQFPSNLTFYDIMGNNSCPRGAPGMHYYAVLCKSYRFEYDDSQMIHLSKYGLHWVVNVRSYLLTWIVCYLHVQWKIISTRSYSKNI